MVQYYRDMWAKRSEMLAPLTDLVGACGETKTTRKNKTKKLPWRWDPIHQQAFDDVKATITKDVVLAYLDFTKPFEMYVTPQIGINTKPVWGATRFGISPQTDMGIPIPVWGLAFFKFFQSRTRSAFSHRKFRQSQRHGAPLLAKNLGNQHTVPAIQELGKQEKWWVLLTSLKVLSSQADNSTANNFSYLHF
jgi:hypothetical protein